MTEDKTSPKLITCEYLNWEEHPELMYECTHQIMQPECGCIFSSKEIDNMLEIKNIYCPFWMWLEYGKIYATEEDVNDVAILIKEFRSNIKKHKFMMETIR